jgi:hypothetical protein
MRWLLLIVVTCWLGASHAQENQIDLARIELMPNEPSPYIMRDWKRVAQGYDSMAYDITKTGLYLPLVFVRSSGVNYPERASYGLDTYVGTFSNENGEGINVLPSLVGASLVGIDKTNQFGRNWVLMSQDYFNHVNGENLYLNNIGGHSGGDWWYDMMPNVYFYQLYDLYGNVGEAELQFTTIADRMAEAVRKMGGKDTPWTKANMNYRAWDFLNMEPNAGGVHEPEAAGAFAWLLYNAYVKTGNPEYLKGAEWSTEFLVGLNSNPSYELQLPYGAYTTARMNAEIGTEYNIEKLIFWIMNRGPLRGWGTIVGNWNGFDVDGLVGEANDGGNDYAFQLNGVQQAGALVPLMRYDKKFARAISKWTLNVANATRLMYPGFLPSHLQDASAWSSVYDPAGVMGYEALREVWNGNSPVSTGDALRSGWAATNLSLYSTSSIGYLGAIIETTDVDKILKIDLTKTDFFGDNAYPSFAFFNPYDELKSVTLDVGNTPVDVYDAISESFLATNVTGPTALNIPPDEVISVVLASASGAITYDNNKMLIDGVVVDYGQTQVSYNYPPRIQSFVASANPVEKGVTITLYAKGFDQETKDLTFSYFLPNDTITGLQESITWQAPDITGTYTLMLVGADEALQTDTAFLSIEVVDELNIAPVINDLTASSRFTSPNGTIDISADVTDANGDAIQYNWSATTGTINGSGADVTWQASGNEGVTTIQLEVQDGRGGEASASIRVLVIDLTSHVAGDLIAWYPFTGNAMDISGNDLHGSVSGAKLTADSIGQPLSAYQFDGVNDHIRVANDPILNFSNGITVTAFVIPETIGDKERFILSHGSWQNRWKISITPEQHIRWTVKATNGVVRDLDSETFVDSDKLYHIACTYDGQFMILYINGRMESFMPFSGAINASPVDLEIGQILPDDPSYSFQGILDEIKIYDYALLPDSVAVESGNPITGIWDLNASSVKIKLHPNPASDYIYVQSPLTHTGSLANSSWMVRDVFGRAVITAPFTGSEWQQLDVSSLTSGTYVVQLTQANNSYSTILIIQ